MSNTSMLKKVDDGTSIFRTGIYKSLQLLMRGDHMEPWGCMWPVCALCVVFFNCVLHAVTAVDRKIWLGWTVGLEFVLHPSNKVRCKLSVCEVFSKCPKTYNENMSQLSLNFKQCLKQRKRVSTTFSQPLLPAS